MRRTILITTLLAGCGSAEVAPISIDHSVVRSLTFNREDPKGVSEGMNLDGFVSASNDGRSCNKSDFVSPDGTPGIDNELAKMLPLIDIAGENALEGLVQGSIDEGRLLMMFEVTRMEDGTADVRVLRGMDMPLLGTDGRILEGQTLGLDPEPLLGEARGTPIEDGVLKTEPFQLRLPIQVFSQLYEVSMPRARVELQIGDDGVVESGLIAGGIPIEQLLTVLNTASEFAGDFEALFGDAIRDSGDLDRDDAGACTSMSAAVSFQAVQAFTFE